MQGLVIRPSELTDGKLFKKALLQPHVLQYFPMCNELEIDDGVHIWEIFCKKGASLTAEIEGVACGLVFLNLYAYKKFAHHCILTIIVDETFRNRGIGTALLKEVFVLAKEAFQLEMLHLEVYEGNPALRLYERMGFKEYGRHPRFIRENNQYRGKILMQRFL